MNVNNQWLNKWNGTICPFTCCSPTGGGWSWHGKGEWKHHLKCSITAVIWYSCLKSDCHVMQNCFCWASVFPRECQNSWPNISSTTPLINKQIVALQCGCLYLGSFWTDCPYLLKSEIWLSPPSWPFSTTMARRRHPIFGPQGGQENIQVLKFFWSCMLKFEEVTFWGAHRPPDSSPVIFEIFQSSSKTLWSCKHDVPRVVLNGVIVKWLYRTFQPIIIDVLLAEW